jgi:hypothetical protein
MMVINQNHIILTTDATNPYGAGNIVAFTNTADYIPNFVSETTKVTLVYQVKDIVDANGNVTGLDFYLSINGKTWAGPIACPEVAKAESKLTVGVAYAPAGYNLKEAVKELYIEE